MSPDWSYVGCVDESDGTRLLTGFGFSSSLQNSVTVCTAICGQMGYKFAGAEFGQEVSQIWDSLNAPADTALIVLLRQ